MRLSNAISVPIVLFGAMAYAVPQRQPVCSNLGAVLNIFASPAFKAKASSFCSDFIRATTSTTSTSIKTSVVATTTTLPDVLTTTTQTTTLLTTSTTTITSYEPNPTSFKTITTTNALSTVYTGAALVKRQRIIAIPTQLRLFHSSLLSGACSCIISQPTSTVVVTTTSTTISSSTVTANPTTTVISVIISSITTTITTGKTTILPPTSTVTSTTTTTTTIDVATALPKCGLKGFFSDAVIDNPDLHMGAPTVPGSAAACIQSCRNTPGCLAVAWQIGEVCRKFSAPVEVIFGGPSTFYDSVKYDRNCPLPP